MLCIYIKVERQIISEEKKIGAADYRDQKPKDY